MLRWLKNVFSRRVYFLSSFVDSGPDGIFLCVVIKNESGSVVATDRMPVIGKFDPDLLEDLVKRVIYIFKTMYLPSRPKLKYKIKILND